MNTKEFLLSLMGVVFYLTFTIFSLLFFTSKVNAVNFPLVRITSQTFGAVLVDSQTALAIPSAPILYRKVEANYANITTTSTVYYSTNPSVTSFNGFPIFPRQQVSIDLDPLSYPVTYYFIREAGEAATMSIRFWIKIFGTD